MKTYKKRIADDILKFKLKSVGAVLVEGAKWCGKTTTAKQFAKSILYMQEPKTVQRNLQLAEIEPSKLLDGKTPHLIDEWQMAPQLWDAIRFEVDQRDEFGQFILTGSSSPADVSKIHHSGAGRIARMTMRPMSLYESKDSNGSISLRDLFNGSCNNISGQSKIDIDYLAFLICRGGWPKALDCSEKIALEQAFNYYNVVVETDISKADNITRNKEKTERLMRAYARGISTQTTLKTILEDMQGDTLNAVDDESVSMAIEALKKIFVVEESLAWNPNLRSKTAIRTSNTRYFTDPSIGTAALGLGPRDLIDDLHAMGLFFENLCIRDLRVYAEALDGTVYHYRDKTGLECDAVIHLRNGSYGLVEIKLGGFNAIETGAQTLNKLEANIDTKRMKAPAFKMVLSGTDTMAYKRADGVLVIPIGCLKD